MCFASVPCIFRTMQSYRGGGIDEAFAIALERLEYSFSFVADTSYCNDAGQTFFSHLHSDQYAQFLYYFANTLWTRSHNRMVCDKLMYLNRILHGFFVSYKAGLPNIFLFNHAVGSVIGNAEYSDFLVINQNITINTSNNEKSLWGKTLRIGKGCWISTGAKIIGAEPIGDRVSIGVNAIVYHQAIEDDQVVVLNDSGETVIRDRIKEKCRAMRCFRAEI